jgi:TPR repeat protein
MKLVLAVLAMCLPVMGADKDKERFEKVKVKALAEKGDAIAQFNLGVMYDEGQGVEQDFKEAVKWYQKAADQGFATAQSNLGVMYFKGQGVEQDFKEAVKWGRKAADQGDAIAQFNLGVMYAKGQGVEQNNVTAYAWWNIAATNGNQNAKKGLSQLAEIMIPAQIAKAEELVKEMVKKNPKLLNKK